MNTSKDFVFLTFLLFSLCLLSCSIEKPKRTQNESIIVEEWSDTLSKPCAYKKSSRMPSETFPFSVADKIVVYSYEGRKYALEEEGLIKKGKFVLNHFKEVVVLNAVQRDSLFNILYNHAGEGVIAVSDCFVPRHSIVFYQKNKALAYIELCLECKNWNYSKVDFGNFCEGKMLMLAEYFKWIGIKKGLDQ